MNITRHILECLDRFGSAPAYTTASGDVAASELARRVRERAAILASAVAPKDPVIVFNLRGLDFWVDTLALWLIGAVTVPVPISTDPTSFATMLKVARPRGYLGAPGQHDEALAEAKVGPVREDGPPAALPDPPGGKELASINFTSGSTGEPKGVLLSHAAILDNCAASLEALGVAPGDRVVIPIPFNFISAVSHFLVCVSAGACAIATEDKLMQHNLAQLIVSARANALGGAPLHLRWVSELCEQSPLPIRWLMASGDHLGVDVIETLERLLPDIRLLVVYGLTEVGGRCCVLDRAKARRESPSNAAALIDSVGKPIRGLTVRVLDDDGAEVPTGEIGEVVLQGESVFDGYVNRPEATADVLRDGRFHTRDMGRVDADGNLYVVGRKDDVFKCSGLKVATIPIADALMDTGFFADVAVRAKEHPISGHVPEALYVLREGKTFQKGEIISELRERIPLHWIPQQFTRVDAIPRTGSGKISRRDLKKIDT